MTVAAGRTINNDKDVARKIPGDALADDSITAAQLAPGAVEAADVADGSITAAKLAANSVITAKILDANVTTGKLAANAVDSTKLANGAVSATAKLADGIVTKAKTAMFISTEQTGTGAPQNVAHGLGVVPAAVFTAPTDLAPATTGDYTVVEGAHDSTNVILTVTTGKKFKVQAWA